MNGNDQEGGEGDVVTRITWDDGTLVSFRAIRTDGDAELGYATCQESGDSVAVVRYADGDVWTTEDWQGVQPDVLDPEDVASWRWRSADGTLGIVVGGLPRRLL